jgi:hypothetical protein
MPGLPGEAYQGSRYEARQRPGRRYRLCWRGRSHIVDDAECGGTSAAAAELRMNGVNLG